MESIRTLIKRDKKESNGLEITSREKEILSLIMFEFSSKEIAGILEISARTVEVHRQNLLKKFQAKNTVGLVRKTLLLDLLHINN